MAIPHVTPGQAEATVERFNAVIDIANNAEERATNAEANTATALEAAERARQDADNAANSAYQAEQLSQETRTMAENAELLANESAFESSQAKTISEQAILMAETAEQSAIEAQQAAVTAQTQATNAANSATQAQTQATASANSAYNAEESARLAQQAAEQAAAEGGTIVTTNGVTQLTWESNTKINTTDITDNLTTQDSAKPLSAKQGYTLNQNKVNKTDVVDNLTTQDAAKPLSAKQGYTLNQNKSKVTVGSTRADVTFTSDPQTQLTELNNNKANLDLMNSTLTIDGVIGWINANNTEASLSRNATNSSVSLNPSALFNLNTSSKFKFEIKYHEDSGIDRSEILDTIIPFTFGSSTKGFVTIHSISSTGVITYSTRDGEEYYSVPFIRSIRLISTSKLPSFARSLLVDKANQDLSNVPGIDFVISSRTGLTGSGYTRGWYRIWKSGFIEQGALYTGPADNSSSVRNLVIPFSNAAYSVTVSAQHAHADGSFERSGFGANPYSSTQFTLYTSRTSNSNKSAFCVMWGV